MSLGDLSSAIQQTISLHYLSRQRAAHNRRFPQVAVFPFDHIGIEIACKGRYEDAALRAIRDFVATKRNRIAIDIGANIGNHTIAFSECFQEVLALEPNETARSLLQVNTLHYPNITVLPFGASNRDARLAAQTFMGNLGGTAIIDSSRARIDRATPPSVRLRVRKLDDVVGDEVRYKVDLIKLDVEGHEVPALEGMTDLLDRSKPVVAIELLHRKLPAGTESLSLELLRLHGYKYFYEIQHVRSRVPTTVPRYLRRILRVVELLVLGPLDIVRLAPLGDPIERRNYRLVLCSHGSLVP